MSGSRKPFWEVLGVSVCEVFGLEGKVRFFHRRLLKFNAKAYFSLCWFGVLLVRALQTLMLHHINAQMD